MPRKPKPPSCEDCYFRKNMLCALELEEPCTTFRPDRPEGLVPPRQPVLLMRPPRWATHPLPVGAVPDRPSAATIAAGPSIAYEDVAHLSAGGGGDGGASPQAFAQGTRVVPGLDRDLPERAAPEFRGVGRPTPSTVAPVGATSDAGSGRCMFPCTTR